MRKYNWTLTVDVLNEEDIISDILCQGLICHGITKFSDLKCARESRCDPFANLKVTPLQVTFAKV